MGSGASPKLDDLEDDKSGCAVSIASPSRAGETGAMFAAVGLGLAFLRRRRRAQ